MRAWHVIRVGLPVWLLSLASLSQAGPADRMAGPTFDCAKAQGRVETMICKDRTLSALDHQLAGVYDMALPKADKAHPSVLKAEQRGWFKGRNDCWKSDDVRACVTRSYQMRIAELQARYRLVPDSGPVRFECDGPQGGEVVATFFQTSWPTLVAERGDAVSLMYQQVSGSGIRYQGRNESFWEHHGEALITWGDGEPEMRCRKVP